MPLTTAIAMTTGGNATSERVTAMTRMPGRSAEVQEAIGKPLMSMAEIVVMMHVGPGATATVVSAIGSHGPCSRGTSTCRADWSARSFAIATVITPYAARSRVRWRLSAHFEWSPVVISETTTIDLPIRGLPTYGISASKG